MRFSFAAVALVLVCSCGASQLAIEDEDESFDAPAASDAALSSTTSLKVDADAQVRSGASANRNYGAAVNLRADADASGDRIESYVRFQVPAVSGRITKAAFRCYVSDGSTNAFDVYGASSSWVESSITYASKPALSGGVVASVVSQGAGAYLSVDVTRLVQSGQAVTLALIPRSADNLSCRSKEYGSNAPTLDLTVDSQSLAVVQPAAGSVVSGTLVLAALINGGASASDAARVEFVVDGVTYGPAVIGLGWNYTLNTAALANGAHQIFARAFDASGHALVSGTSTFTVNNGIRVYLATPAQGAVVSGASVVTATGVEGLAAQQVARIELVADGARVLGSTAVISYGYVITFDSTALGDGAHTLMPRAITTAGAAISGAAVSVSVSNTAVKETWGEHLGMSIWPDRKNIEMTKALGFKWVRYGWELGWGAFDDSLIAYTHSLGLKILWVCQKGSNGSVHPYADADVAAFATYCAAAVDKGVDAIEIGNEWNHLPFYAYNGGAPDSTFKSQAKFFDATTAAIRAKSSTITIMNSGWSPESTSLAPVEAMVKTLDNSTTFKTKANAIANHPYAYSCDSPLLCGYPGRKDWNAFLATQDVYAAAKARGFDHPVWMTELGGPSGNGTNAYTGAPYSLQTQAQLFKDYFVGIGNMRSAGVPFGVIFFHTAQDGQSATIAVELTFGAFDKNWVIKPAGQVLKDQAVKAW